MDIQSLIGLAGAPVLIVAITDHLKRFMAAMPWTVDRANAAPWPLVSDAIGVLWVLALWRGGLLAEALPGVELLWPVVIPVGLTLGIGSSALVDGKRALRAPGG